MFKVDKFQISQWGPNVCREDVKQVFKDHDPFKAFITLSHYSLGWFVSQIFCNAKGKPLVLAPFQLVLLDILWYKKFPMLIMSRGSGKSWLVALYSLLRAILVPGSKVVIAGAGLRQSKNVFRYIHTLYDQSPVIQEALKTWGGPKYGSDECSLRVGMSNISAIPLGESDKVRGKRASCLIVDEFAVVSEEAFDIVLAPFTSTVMNPTEKMMIKEFVTKLKKLNANPKIIDFIDKSQGFGNQVVIASTATYRQNHLYRRYQSYLSFIKSGGDEKLLKRALEEQALASGGKTVTLDSDEIRKMARRWKDYAVVKLPYTAMPDGFLDEDSIRSHKAIFPPHRFMTEYLSEFPEDSDGFIKRSWIERATPRHANKPVIVELYGDPKCNYVLGLDPAKHNDNFGALVLKLTPRGKELVYCDAWTRTDFGVSAQKIREILKRFNIVYIAMDKDGGGSATMEWLCKKTEGVEDSELLWPIREQIENSLDLGKPGRKIVELVNFRGEWIAEAAHSLENDIIHGNVLFPYTADSNEAWQQYSRHFEIHTPISDSVKELIERDLWGIDEWEAQELQKKSADKVKSNLGIMNNINECINESCAIVREVTPGGTERFILPSLTEQPEGLDMRRRDRFTALMLANYAAKVYLSHGHIKNLPGIAPGYKGNTLTSRSVHRRGRAAY